MLHNREKTTHTESETTHSKRAGERILFVDDDPYFRAPVTEYLVACGYQVTEASNADEAQRLQAADPFPVILSDIILPGTQGTRFLEWVSAAFPDSFVIMISGTGEINDVVDCVSKGAYDFLRKPLDNLARINLVVHRALEQRRMQLENRALLWKLQERNNSLAETVRDRTEAIQVAYDKVQGKNTQLIAHNEEMEDVYLHIIAFISDTLEYKDGYTAGHSERVRRIALLLAGQLGCTKDQLRLLDRAAKLHDIGKLVIDIAFINKPGPLTAEELKLFRKHPETGAALLTRLSFLHQEANLVLHHHERHDGKGYPSGIAGDDIPFEAAIISLADALDAMLSQRSYKAAMSFEEAIEEIRSNNGTQFHPRVTAAFLELAKNNRPAFEEILGSDAPPTDLLESTGGLTTL